MNINEIQDAMATWVRNWGRRMDPTIGFTVPITPIVIPPAV